MKVLSNCKAISCKKIETANGKPMYSFRMESEFGQKFYATWFGKLTKEEFESYTVEQIIVLDIKNNEKSKYLNIVIDHPTEENEEEFEIDDVAFDD